MASTSGSCATTTTTTTNILIKEENIKKESSPSDSTGDGCDGENGVVTSNTGETIANATTGTANSAASMTATTVTSTTSSTDTSAVTVTTSASAAAINSSYTPNGIKTEIISSMAKASTIHSDGTNKPILLANEIKQEKAVDNNVTSVVNSVALNVTNDDRKLDDIRLVLFKCRQEQNIFANRNFGIFSKSFNRHTCNKLFKFSKNSIDLKVPHFASIQSYSHCICILNVCRKL